MKSGQLSGYPIVVDLLARLGEATALIDDLSDGDRDESCDLDTEDPGLCRTHGWYSAYTSCPYPRAAAFLREQRGEDWEQTQ